MLQFFFTWLGRALPQQHSITRQPTILYGIPLNLTPSVLSLDGLTSFQNTRRLSPRTLLVKSANSVISVIQCYQN